MKKSLFRKVIGTVLLLLAGLTQVVTAQQAQTEELIITNTVEYTDVVNVKKLTIKGTSEDPTIDIYLQNNSTIETITVESGKAEIFFSGAEGVMYNLGDITIAEGAELTLSLGFPEQMHIGSVTNNGRFIDLTGSV